MPTNPRTIEDLDKPETLVWEQRETWAEWSSWIFIAAVVAAALLGLLGSGPWSDRRDANTDGSLAVEYDGIQRCMAPARLVVHFTPSRNEREHQLALPQSFTAAAVIEQVVPEPVATENRDGQTVYTLRARASESTAVILHYEYERFGRFAHELQIVGHEPVVVSQWVLP